MPNEQSKLQTPKVDWSLTAQKHCVENLQKLQDCLPQWKLSDSNQKQVIYFSKFESEQFPICTCSVAIIKFKGFTKRAVIIFLTLFVYSVFCVFSVCRESFKSCLLLSETSLFVALREKSKFISKGSCRSLLELTSFALAEAAPWCPINTASLIYIYIYPSLTMHQPNSISIATSNQQTIWRKRSMRIKKHFFAVDI